MCSWSLLSSPTFYKPLLCWRANRTHLGHRKSSVAKLPCLVRSFGMSTYVHCSSLEHNLTAYLLTLSATVLKFRTRSVRPFLAIMSQIPMVASGNSSLTSITAEIKFNMTCSASNLFWDSSFVPKLTTPFDGVSSLSSPFALSIVCRALYNVAPDIEALLMFLSSIFIRRAFEAPNITVSGLFVLVSISLGLFVATFVSLPSCVTSSSLPSRTSSA